MIVQSTRAGRFFHDCQLGLDDMLQDCAEG
jgi:hypothetical protein